MCLPYQETPWDENKPQKVENTKHKQSRENTQQLLSL